MVTVTVTVTEALVLRPLLEDRGRITESIRILVLVTCVSQAFAIRSRQANPGSELSVRGWCAFN